MLRFAGDDSTTNKVARILYHAIAVQSVARTSILAPLTANLLLLGPTDGHVGIVRYQRYLGQFRDDIQV